MFDNRSLVAFPGTQSLDPARSESRSVQASRIRHRNLLRCKLIAVCIGLSVQLVVLSNASAQRNCNTALSRIAKAAAERAVADNRHKACSGFKRGELAIDKTNSLVLKQFELCEDGPLVTARLTVYIECATSDAAFIKTSAADTLSAVASGNLDTCTVSDTRVQGSGFLTEVGLNLADATNKLKEAAVREIKQYCVK